MDGIATYLAVALASLHIDPAVPFNETNPGLSIGVKSSQGVSAEIGAYKNSFGNGSAYAVVAAEAGAPVAFGAFAGIATYRAEHILPTWPRFEIGNGQAVIPIAGVQATANLTNHLAIRTRLIPADGKAADAILTLQLVVTP